MPLPAAPTALSARALGIAGLVGLVGVTLAHPSATRMHTWPWALTTALIWLLPLALLAGLGCRADTWRLPHKTTMLALTILASGAVISAWASPFASLSLPRVWPTLGGTAFFFVLHHWLTTPERLSSRREWVARTIALGGAVIMAFSLVTWRLQDGPAFFSTRNTFPFGHSNYTAGYIVLLFPWLLLRIVQTGGIARIAWSLVASSAAFALVGTSSRGGVLALALVFGAGGAAVVVHAAWPPLRKLYFAVALGLVAAIAVLTNSRLRDLVLQQRWSADARESNLQRAAMLKAGQLLGEERPLLGWGPGTVPLAYPHVRAALDGGVDNVLQLHNTPAQLWATLGTGGVIAGLLLVVGAATATRKAVNLAPRIPAVFAAGASLAAYAVFSLTDHQFDLPVIVATAAAGLAVLTASAEGGVALRLSINRRIAVGLCLTALSGGPAVWLGRDLCARWQYDRGLTALGSGHPQEFVSAMQAASRLSPQDPYFYHQIAGYLIAERKRATQSQQQNELARAAGAVLEASLPTHAHAEFAHFNLGWLLLDLGKPADAARHFSAAARLVPDKGGVYFGLGLALQAAGRPNDAVRAFALEWLSDPRSVTSSSWEIPLLAPLRPAIREETQRLYARLRQAFPRAIRAEAWADWWAGESVSPRLLAPGFNAEASAFAAALPTLESRAALPASDEAWARLYAAWQRAQNEGESENARATAFALLVPSDLEFSQALLRRAQRHRANFREFLAAGSEDDPALLRTMHRERPGYGVLALHPEGPVLSDAYFVQENRLVADFAAALFPPKGWLPGRFLLGLLPADQIGAEAGAEIQPKAVRHP